MDRRRFVALLGGALAAPLARAQAPGRTRRVGVLLSAPEAELRAHVAALRERLAAHGFVERSNLQLEVRGVGLVDQDAVGVAVRELLAQRTEVLLVLTPGRTRLVRTLAGTTPIVFALVQDPVAAGLVTDLRLPGGTMTGTSWRGGEIHAKRLELLREALPRARKVVFAYLFGSMASYGDTEAVIRGTAGRLGLELVDSMLAPAAATAASAGADAIFVVNPLWQLGQRSQTREMLEAARARRIPVFFPEPEPVDLGGLMSYGPDFVDEVRRAAEQVARILKGAKPGELAVDQATRFELVVNRRTERELGITLPQSILVRADRVIE